MTAAKKAASAKPEAATEFAEGSEPDTSKYVVVAPRIAISFGNQVLQFASGDILPAGADEASLKHHLDLGFIAEAQ